MNKEELAPIAAKIAPAVGGTAYGFSNFTLNEMVALATLIYVILQIGLLLPKYWSVFFRKGGK